MFIQMCVCDLHRDKIVGIPLLIESKAHGVSKIAAERCKVSPEVENNQLIDVIACATKY